MDRRAVGNCLILLTNGDDLATDTFRLVDVVLRAQAIIAECPGKSKKALGGLALIGHGRHFFVAVNGPGFDPSVGREVQVEGGSWGRNRTVFLEGGRGEGGVGGTLGGDGRGWEGIVEGLGG